MRDTQGQASGGQLGSGELKTGCCPPKSSNLAEQTDFQIVRIRSRLRENSQETRRGGIVLGVLESLWPTGN